MTACFWIFIWILTSLHQDAANHSRHIIPSTNTTSSTTLICRVHGDGYCVRIKESCEEAKNCLGERCSSLDDCPGAAQVKCMKERCGVEHTCESDNHCPFEMQCVDSECVTRESCPDLLTCLIGRLILCSNGVCRSLSKSGASHPSQQYAILESEEHQPRAMFRSGFLDEGHGKLDEKGRVPHSTTSRTGNHLGNNNDVEEKVNPYNDERQQQPFQQLKVAGSKAPYRGIVPTPEETIADLYLSSSDDSEENTGIREVHATPLAPLNLPNRDYPGRLLKPSVQKPWENLKAATASASTPNADNPGYWTAEAKPRDEAPGETSSPIPANASDETQNGNAASDEDSDGEATEAQVPLATAAPFRRRLLPLYGRSLVGATATLYKFIQNARDESNSSADSVPTPTVEAVPAKPIEESLKQTWTSALDPSATVVSSSTNQAASHGRTSASISVTPSTPPGNFSNETQSTEAASEESSEEDEEGMEVTPTTEEASVSTLSPEAVAEHMPSTTSAPSPGRKKLQLETLQAIPLDEALEETSTSASAQTAAVATSSTTRRASLSSTSASVTPTPTTTAANASDETQNSETLSDEPSKEKTSETQVFLSTAVARTSTTEATEVEETAASPTAEGASTTTPSLEAVALREPLDETASSTTLAPSPVEEEPRPKAVPANTHDQVPEDTPTSAPAQTIPAVVASTSSSSETVTPSTTVVSPSKEAQSSEAVSEEASVEEGAVANPTIEEESASASSSNETTPPTTSVQSPVSETSRPKIVQAGSLDKGRPTSAPAQSASIVMPSWTTLLTTTEEPIIAENVSNEMQNTDSSSDEDSNEEVTVAQIPSTTAARTSTTEKPTDSDAPVNATLIPVEVENVDKTEETSTTSTPISDVENHRAMEAHDTLKGTLTSAPAQSATVPTSPTTAAPNEAVPSRTSTHFPSAGYPASAIIPRKELQKQTTVPAQSTYVTTSAIYGGENASAVKAMSTSTDDLSNEAQSSESASEEAFEEEGAKVAPATDGASASSQSSEEAVTLKNSSRKSPDEAVLSTTSAPSSTAEKYQPMVVSTEPREEPQKQASTTVPAQSTTVPTSPTTEATPDESTTSPTAANSITTILPRKEPQKQTSTTVPTQSTYITTPAKYGGVNASESEATSAATVEPSKEAKSSEDGLGEASEEEVTGVAPATGGASVSTPSSEGAVTLRDSSKKSPDETVLSKASTPSPAAVKYQPTVVSTEPSKEPQKQTSTTAPAQTTTVTTPTIYDGVNTSLVEAKSTDTVELSKEAKSSEDASSEASEEEGTEVAPATGGASVSTPSSEGAVTLRDSSKKLPDETVLSKASTPSPAAVKYQPTVVSTEPSKEPQKQTSTTAPAQTTTVTTPTIYDGVNTSLVEAKSTDTVELSKEAKSSEDASSEASEEEVTGVAPATGGASVSTPSSEGAVTLRDSSKKSPDETVLSKASTPSPAAVKYQPTVVSTEPRREPQKQTSTTAPAQTTTVTTSSTTQGTIYGDKNASVVKATSTAAVKPSKEAQSSEDASSEAFEEQGTEVAPATEGASASLRSSEEVATLRDSSKKSPDETVLSKASTPSPAAVKYQPTVVSTEPRREPQKQTSTTAPTQATTVTTPTIYGGENASVVEATSTATVEPSKEAKSSEDYSSEALEEEGTEVTPATKEASTSTPSSETVAKQKPPDETMPSTTSNSSPTLKNIQVDTLPEKPRADALKRPSTSAPAQPATAVRPSTTQGISPYNTNSSVVTVGQSTNSANPSKQTQGNETVLEEIPEEEGTAVNLDAEEEPASILSLETAAAHEPADETATADPSKETQTTEAASEETSEDERIAEGPTTERASVGTPPPEAFETSEGETSEAQLLPTAAVQTSITEKPSAPETLINATMEADEGRRGDTSLQKMSTSMPVVDNLPEKETHEVSNGMSAADQGAEGASQSSSTLSLVTVTPSTTADDFSKQTQGSETASEETFEDEETAVSPPTEEPSGAVQGKLPDEAVTDDFSKEAQNTETGPEKISEDAKTEVNSATKEAVKVQKLPDEAAMDEISKETQSTETGSEKAFEGEETAVNPLTEEASTLSSEAVKSSEVTQAQIQSTTMSSASVTTPVAMEDSSNETQSINATSSEDSEVETTEAPSVFSNAVSPFPTNEKPVVSGRLINATIPPIEESRGYKPLQNTTGQQSDEREVDVSAASSTAAPSPPAPTATIAVPTSANESTLAETTSPSNKTLKSGTPMTAVQLSTLAPSSEELYDAYEDQTNETDRLAADSNSLESAESNADSTEWKPLPSWTLDTQQAI